MKLIQEALKSVRRLDNEDEPIDHDEQSSGDELDFDLDGDKSELPVDDEHASDEVRMGEEPHGKPEPDDEFNLNGVPDDAGVEPDDTGISNIANRASEDPNRRGLIRTVKDTHLVYKRETESGTYEELWIFNVGDFKNEMQTRRAILAGTDIPTNGTSSPDGKQEYSIWTSGNVEFVKVTGLPS